MVNFNKRFVQLVVVFCGEFQLTCGDICGDIYNQFVVIIVAIFIAQKTNKSTKTEMTKQGKYGTRTHTVGMGVYTLVRLALE